MNEGPNESKQATRSDQLMSAEGIYELSQGDQNEKSEHSEMTHGLRTKTFHIDLDPSLASGLHSSWKEKQSSSWRPTGKGGGGGEEAHETD